MKRQKFRERFSTRRGNSPRRKIKQPRRIQWQLEKQGEEWIAKSGTGISVYADSLEKIREWIEA